MNKNRCLRSGLLLFAALLASLPLASFGETPVGNKKLRVLFVGNSLTFVNDLPKLTGVLAQDRGSVLEYEMHAPGGYTFAQHARDPRLLALIKKGGWDFVVLQDQSLVPAYPRAKTEVFPYAQKLSALVRAANPLAQIAFYQTMAKKNGDRKNLRDFPEMGTYAGLQKKLNEAYLHMARENRGVLVPVGEAWQKMRSEHPSVDLYTDGVHPSLAGSYLAACVFYSVLFEDTLAGLKPPPGIDKADARAIQATVEALLRPKK
jgi:hypothetical protein